MISSCIYSIRNTFNGKAYVGSAVNFLSRKRCHLNRLRYNRHHSILLQRAWEKHGEGVFEFVVLEEVVDRSNLIEREQHWIDTLRSADPAWGYNIAPKAGSRLGSKNSPEARAKMVAWQSQRTPEFNARVTAHLKGRKHTEATLAKMRGQKRSDETRARMSVANRGKERSADQRARISATLTGRKTGPQSLETIAKRVAATRATKLAKAGVP